MTKEASWMMSLPVILDRTVRNRIGTSKEYIERYLDGKLKMVCVKGYGFMNIMCDVLKWQRQ